MSQVLYKLHGAITRDFTRLGCLTQEGIVTTQPHIWTSMVIGQVQDRKFSHKG